MEVENRQAVLDKINAANLVPIAVANAMLFVGSNMKPEDCSFQLETYFVVTGTLGLIIAIFGQLGKLLVNNFSKDVTPCEHHILYVILLINDFLRFSELFSLFGGLLMVLWHANRVVFDEADTYEKAGIYYCKRGSFVFASVFLSLLTLIVVLAALIFFAGLVHEVTVWPKPQQIEEEPKSKCEKRENGKTKPVTCLLTKF